MRVWFEKLLLAWIPLFVTTDPIGLIPIFLGLTHGIETPKLKRIARHALLTAFFVAIAFMFLGHSIFRFLSITVFDFQIAGGLILFAVAAKDLLGTQESILTIREDVAVVPLGMPLIAGPATITTLLLLIDTVGVQPTLAALSINLLFIYFAFSNSHRLVGFAGITGLKAFSKIISLLLAAIAVHMIRQGLQSV